MSNNFKQLLKEYFEYPVMQKKNGKFDVSPDKWYIVGVSDEKISVMVGPFDKRTQAESEKKTFERSLQNNLSGGMDMPDIQVENGIRLCGFFTGACNLLKESNLGDIDLQNILAFNGGRNGLIYITVERCLEIFGIKSPSELSNLLRKTENLEKLAVEATGSKPLKTFSFSHKADAFKDEIPRKEIIRSHTRY